ncbi:MAG TPA: hypothetical protein VK741_25135 [Acetobacteraceae bacterium]|nr:hypothetical protein [Acetobacteraceae bacterium]
MAKDDITTIEELFDTDLDMVAAGSRSSGLVSISIPIDINTGIAIGNVINIAVLSAVSQIGSTVETITQRAG